MIAAALLASSCSDSGGNREPIAATDTLDPAVVEAPNPPEEAAAELVPESGLAARLSGPCGGGAVDSEGRDQILGILELDSYSWYRMSAPTTAAWVASSIPVESTLPPELQEDPELVEPTRLVRLPLDVMESELIAEGTSGRFTDVLLHPKTTELLASGSDGDLYVALAADPFAAERTFGGAGGVVGLALFVATDGEVAVVGTCQEAQSEVLAGYLASVADGRTPADLVRALVAGDDVAAYADYLAIPR